MGDVNDGRAEKILEQYHCDHCWHSTGSVLTSNPPQFPEYCCKCDARRTRMSNLHAPDTKHGKYYRG